jgi:ClpP class serine protease
LTGVRALLLMLNSSGGQARTAWKNFSQITRLR